MRNEVRGTPANPSDSTSTLDLILLNFQRQTGINLNDLPQGSENQAFLKFAEADTRIARALNNLNDISKELQLAEERGAQLLISTKQDETANALIFSQVNHLKQLAEPIAQCKKALSDLLIEKPTVFKNALESISIAPNKEAMTKIELERHKPTLLAIKKQYDTANNLKSQIAGPCSILKEYESEIKAVSGATKRGEPAVTPKQQPGVG